MSGFDWFSDGGVSNAVHPCFNQMNLNRRKEGGEKVLNNPCF